MTIISTKDINKGDFKGASQEAQDLMKEIVSINKERDDGFYGFVEELKKIGWETWDRASNSEVKFVKK